MPAMNAADAGPSYIALRVHPSGDGLDWWTAASARADDAPTAIRALLAGRTRVELSRREAEQALRWASALAGWDQRAVKPLFVYPEAALPRRSGHP